jgi:hypothetical protein
MKKISSIFFIPSPFNKQFNSFSDGDNNGRGGVDGKSSSINFSPRFLAVNTPLCRVLK